jgi:hypothetical protein
MTHGIRIDRMAETAEFLSESCTGRGHAGMARSISNGVGVSGNIVAAHSSQTSRGLEPRVACCSTTWFVNS